MSIRTLPALLRNFPLVGRKGANQAKLHVLGKGRRQGLDKSYSSPLCLRNFSFSSGDGGKDDRKIHQGVRGDKETSREIETEDSIKRDHDNCTGDVRSSRSSNDGGGVGDVGSSGSEKKHLWTTTEALSFASKHYAEDLGKAYANMERNLMSRIKESNQKRFRILFFGGLGALGFVLFVFGKDIREWLSGQTAGIAKETLENEQLKIQTQELATAVIQTILNDKEVLNQAAKFLHEAANAQETQDALLSLTQHVLRHPDTVKETTRLIKFVIEELYEDEVKQQFSIMIFQYFHYRPKPSILYF